MADEVDKSKQGRRTTAPIARVGAGGASSNDDIQTTLQTLIEELRHERGDKERLHRELEKERQRGLEREERWEKRWEQREQQWEQREQQWEQERDSFSKQVDELKSQVKDLGLQLKTVMGITPSSEKGSSLDNHSAAGSGDGGDNGNGNNNSDGSGDDEPGSISSYHENKYRYMIRCKRRPRPDDGFDSCTSIQEWWTEIGSEPEFIPPPADIFGTQVFQVREGECDLSFTDDERVKLFGCTRGLHSKIVESTVYDLDISIVKLKCFQERLTDFNSGLSYTKEKSLSFKGSQASWSMLAQLSVLIAEYAFPMERLSRALGEPYFSSGNISRWFMKSAESLLSIYIAKGQALGRVEHLKVDDTSCLVLDMRSEAKTRGLTADKHLPGASWDKYLDDRSAMLTKGSGVDLVTPVIDSFGRVSETKQGAKAKISLNTTIVSGKLNRHDPSSMVYFYRSHFGQAGNLLSRLLEHRTSQDQNLIVIQGDLSSQNHVEASVSHRLIIIYVGCMSHARRPFFRYRERDKQLCFYMLRCFAILAQVEGLIRRGPLTHARILKLRQRHSRRIWEAIKDVCEVVVAGQRHATINNHLWRKGDKLYGSCEYIIKHFEELTYYLDHPIIDLDNNSSEQGLRGEKLIEASSHFRKSENGRVALDIHRTMIASCNACGLEYGRYLQFVNDADHEEVAKAPERFFPHVVAQTLCSRDPPSTGDDSSSTSSENLH